MQVTVVVPFGKAVPEAREQDTVTPGQLSVAAGVVNVTTAVDSPGSVDLTMLAGQEPNAGFSRSRTVTRCWQVAVLPFWSVAIQLIRVTPLG